jgi:hypothetical protein
VCYNRCHGNAVKALNICMQATRHV